MKLGPPIDDNPIVNALYWLQCYGIVALAGGFALGYI
jgi:hypothetical protein